MTVTQRKSMHNHDHDHASYTPDAPDAPDASPAPDASAAPDTPDTSTAPDTSDASIVPDTSDTPHAPHVNSQPPQANDADYETANKHHFDAVAQQYDEREDAQKYARKIGRAMRDTGLFRQGVTTVMDFACGTGLISRALAPEDPKLIVGVDISQGMVDRYNKVVSDHGISFEEMRAVCVVPHEHRLPGLESMTFDVIVCAAAYHHFPSIEEVTEMLVAYLNPGGSLLVADILHAESTHNMFPADMHHVVAHRGGFTEEDIRSTFDKAGLKNVSFEVVAHGRHREHPVDFFLARGDK